MAINSVMIIPKMTSNSSWLSGFNAEDKQLKNRRDKSEKCNSNNNGDAQREYPRDDLFKPTIE